MENGRMFSDSLGLGPDGGSAASRSAMIARPENSPGTNLAHHSRNNNFADRDEQVGRPELAQAALKNCSLDPLGAGSAFTMVVDLAGEYPLDQATILFGYVTPFVVLISIATNLFVVAVLTRRHMRTGTNIILCTLSLVDLLTILIGSPWYFYIYTLGHYKENLNWFTCYSHSVFIEGLPVFLHNASIWLTVLLAGQRYFCIRYPVLACRWCTKPRIKQSIGLIILVAFVSQLTRFFDNEFAFDSDCNQCWRTAAKWVLDFGPDLYFGTYFSFRILFVYLIPCVSLVTLNCLLYLALKRAERKRTELLGPRYELEEVGWNVTASSSDQRPASSDADLLALFRDPSATIARSETSTCTLDLMRAGPEQSTGNATTDRNQEPPEGGGVTMDNASRRANSNSLSRDQAEPDGDGSDSSRRLTWADQMGSERDCSAIEPNAGGQMAPAQKGPSEHFGCRQQNGIQRQELVIDFEKQQSLQEDDEETAASDEEDADEEDEDETETRDEHYCDHNDERPTKSVASCGLDASSSSESSSCLRNFCSVCVAKLNRTDSGRAQRENSGARDKRSKRQPSATRRQQDNYQNKVSGVTAKRRPRRVRDSNRTTLMLIVVVTVYLVIEIPSAVVTTLHTIASAFNENSDKDDFVSNLANYTKLYSNFLIIFSYSLNFSIYCSMSKKFRVTFRDLLTCRSPSKRIGTARRTGSAKESLYTTSQNGSRSLTELI